MRLGLTDSRPWKRALLVFVLSGILGSCSPDDLLDVAYPDYITEQAIESASGAEALRVAAIGGFARFLNQGPAAVVNDALWSDQLVSARIYLDFLDHRTAYPTADDIGYIDWSEAHNQALRAVKGMTEYFPDGPDKDTKIGHMYVLDGVGMTILAELYCNGIPFGEVVDGEMVFEETPLTYNQVFERAIERLDAALAILPSSATDLRNYALVAKGRALLNLDRPSEAAAAVASVPTDFKWDTDYSGGSMQNGIYSWGVAYGNFSPANREGNGNHDACDGTGQGLPYICEGDPRVRIETPSSGPGFDGSTPVYTILDHASPDSPVTTASGIEARLIEAEADLRAGGSSWLTILNDLRATMITGLQPLADPGTEDARVDLLFKERAYWMYLTAHRTGDLRRLVRQYGRQATDVFPSGAYFKGGTYGNEFVMQIHEAEMNRPKGAPPFEGCINLDI